MGLEIRNLFQVKYIKIAKWIVDPSMCKTHDLYTIYIRHKWSRRYMSYILLLAIINLDSRIIMLRTIITPCHMSRDMTKPTKWVCAKRRLRSAWASAQSDQSLRCLHVEILGPKLAIERTAKTLIRLGGDPGWSESSLGAQSLCWFCHVATHFVFLYIFHKYEYRKRA